MGLEMIDVGWLSVLPPLIAITLALISKEVYSSLFLGVLSGMCVYCFSTGGNILQAATYVFDMIALKIGENGYMIIFLVLLGSLVVVVTRSGGSGAYGQWAGKRIKKAVSAKLATALLGLLIFVDDGFNCLTVRGRGIGVGGCRRLDCVCENHSLQFVRCFNHCYGIFLKHHRF